ncbi:hypothetical protein BDA96_06G069700 [Sorghum bicolor]|uniref:TNase-like domain-containing protein n=1 Tax=Sorghum bicolor TaxID=4558 RepID=A0A921UB76_SORBI|nr:hypothetical protein BDA96_06G069700 [Sorghum bicolor]
MAASAVPCSGWKRGKVKAVPSGDTLLIMDSVPGDAVPPEKSLILSCIIAPRLARRYGTDEPFAWESREYGTVYLGDTNIAYLVVAQGFAKEHDIIEASTRILPSSTNPSDVKDFFAQMKGKALEAIVEQVRDDRFGREAKHFTETRVLNREVRIILRGTDSFDNMFASVYYWDGNTDKDLALELIENVWIIA